MSAALTLLALPATVEHLEGWERGNYTFPPVCFPLNAELAKARLEKLDKPIRCMAFVLGGALAILTWPARPKTPEAVRMKAQMRVRLREMLEKQSGTTLVVVAGVDEAQVVELEELWRWEDDYETHQRAHWGSRHSLRSCEMTGQRASLSRLTITRLPQATRCLARAVGLL